MEKKKDNQLMKFNSFYYFHIKRISTKQGFQFLFLKIVLIF